MPTSGTYTYTITAANLILSALRIVGAYDPEDANTSTANQQSTAAEALEMMLKSWGSRGLQLWERRYGAVFFQPNQSFYRLGGPGPNGDHGCFTNPNGSGFVRATVTTAASVGATAVTLSVVNNSAFAGLDTVTIASGWFIGIERDDGGLQWTTVNGAPSGTTVNLNAALVANVSVGNVVYAYATKLIKPLRVHDCFIRQTHGNDSPVNIISRDVYNTFGQKNSLGTPVEIAVDTQRSYMDLYFYPTPSQVDQFAFVELAIPIQDVGATSNEMDLPAEWIEAIKFNLALRIAPEYGLTKSKYNSIKELAMFSFNNLSGYDQENASVYFQPEQR